MVPLMCIQHCFMTKLHCLGFLILNQYFKYGHLRFSNCFTSQVLRFEEKKLYMPLGNPLLN
jgi:hypothetical protein